MKDRYETTVMSSEQISKILPHRYPFLLVDRVVEFEAGKINILFSHPFHHRMIFFDALEPAVNKGENDCPVDRLDPSSHHSQRNNCRQESRGNKVHYGKRAPGNKFAM